MIAHASISTDNGNELGITYFAPSNAIEPKGQVVVCAATGVLQGFYKDFALFLASRGLGVYTFDYRGIGASRKGSLKGFKANLSDWANDIATVAAHAKKRNAELPLFAVTHSVGGQLLCLTESAKNWDGVLTVASQTGYWPYFNGRYKMRMWLFWYVMLPMFSRITGYFPAKKMGLFEDLPKGVATQWSAWGKHPDYMRSEFPKAHFDDLQCAVRGYSILDDEEFAPKAAVDWLHQQFINAEVERIHLVPKEFNLNSIGHFNFFRKSMQTLFWEDAFSFFEKESNKRLIKL